MERPCGAEARLEWVLVGRSQNESMIACDRLRSRASHAPPLSLTPPSFSKDDVGSLCGGGRSSSESVTADLAHAQPNQVSHNGLSSKSPLRLFVRVSGGLTFSSHVHSPTGRFIVFSTGQVQVHVHRDRYRCIHTTQLKSEGRWRRLTPPKAQPPRRVLPEHEGTSTPAARAGRRRRGRGDRRRSRAAECAHARCPAQGGGRGGVARCPHHRCAARLAPHPAARLASQLTPHRAGMLGEGLWVFGLLDEW